MLPAPQKKKETQNRKKPSERQQKDCGINRGAVAGLNWFLCQRSEGKSRESKTSFREYKTIVRKDGQIVYLQKKRGIKKGYKVSHCSVDPCYGQGVNGMMSCLVPAQRSSTFYRL